MIYVTSDIHGKFDSLKKLLEKSGFNDGKENFLFILGDVIDRNEDGGIKILKWLTVQPNVQLLLGNHEHMMLLNSWAFEEITTDSLERLRASDISSLRIWQENGGDVTLRALSAESGDTRQDILDYLRDCPLYETVTAGGHDYILVHGGLGNFSEDKPLYEYTESEILWERPYFDTVYSPEKYTVIFGHTPTGHYGSQYKDRMIKTDSWINIDTGAAGGREPMLLRLDDMKEFYIDEI